jgi:hypothetical protein
MSDDVL